jgi:O-antigen/teichoic acid export membrane protein
MSFLGLNSAQSYLIYQVARYASAIAVNIIMAKSYLQVSDIGKFESFIFYASALSFFWITGISQGLLSLHDKFNSKNCGRNPQIFNAFALMTVLSLILSAFLALGNIFNPGMLINEAAKPEIFFLSAYVLIYPLGFVIEFILLLNHKNKTLAIYGIFSLIAMILFVAFPPLFRPRIEYSIYGLFFIAICKVVFLLILIKEKASFKYQHEAMIELIKTSLPLVGVSFISGSAAYIDGFIVGHFFDSKTFALFRFGAREFPLFLLVASSFETSMIPKFSKVERLSDNLLLIKNKSRQYIRYFIPLSIFLLVISQFLFQNIFNKNFHESYYIFDIYLLLVLCRFIFPTSILVGMGKNKMLLIIGTVELFINIFSSLVLAFSFGYMGVAYGTIIAYFSERIMLLTYLKSKFKIKASSFVPLKELIFLSVALIIVFVMKLVIL